MINIKPIYTTKKVQYVRNNISLRPRIQRYVTVKSFPIDWEFQSYIIGQGITIFTFTYCTLNWLFYRRIRKQIEKNEEEKNKK